MRIVVGMIILVMAVKVLARNAPAVGGNTRVVVDLYGAQLAMGGYGLGAMVALMGVVGLALMAFGIVTLRRARLRERAR